MPEKYSRIKIIANLLGYGGVIPFLYALAGIAFGDTELVPFYMHSFLSYGAIILTFIGAVHWGLIMNMKSTSNCSWFMLGSVVPAIVSWIAMMLSTKVALSILLSGFIITYIYEKTLLWELLFPDWYKQLRTNLTIIVSIHLLTVLYLSL